MVGLQEEDEMGRREADEGTEVSWVVGLKAAMEVVEVVGEQGVGEVVEEMVGVLRGVDA